MQPLLLTILLIISLQLSAQEKKIEQQIDWSGNSIQLHTISDKAKKRICTVIINKRDMKVCLFDGSMQWKEPFQLKKQSNEKLLGGFFKNNKLYIMLDNTDREGLHCIEIDLATSAVNDFEIPFDLQKEKVIDRISAGDHFLYFTINKKTSEFSIHDFTESRFITTRYTFEDDLWKQITDLHAFTRDLRAEKIDFEGDCGVEVAAAPNKIYVQNDTLHFIVNKLKGTTKIFSFSLKDQKVDVRTIDHGVTGTNAIGQNVLVDNSFLFKDRLYYIYATSDSLRINIIDFHSGAIIKTFFVGKDDEITFKNTPIVQDGSTMIKDNKRDLEKTRQLLRKMSNAEAFIYATTNANNQVEVAVGSYQKVTSGGGGGMWMAGGGVVGAAPTMVYMPTGGFYRSNWTKSARFKMLLNPTTAEHIEGDVNRSINEKIESYTKDVKIPSEAENLFMCNSAYYYAYYDKDNRKLCIVKF